MCISRIAASITASSQHSAKVKFKVVLGVAFSALGGCSLIPPADLQPPQKLVQVVASESGEIGVLDQGAGPDQHMRERSFKVLPVLKAEQRPQSKSVSSHLFPPDEGADIVLTLNNMPLPAFINEIFGSILVQDFQLAPEVAGRKDLVSVRITTPHNRQGLYELARSILGTYGVVISHQGEYLRFVLGREGEIVDEQPLILTGAALPNVPESQRPVILVRGMEVISTSDAYGMLRSVFEREQRLKIQRDNSRNALRLQGPSDLVGSAAEILNTLDQPLMRGAHSLRIEPRYVSATVLSERLVSTLKAQGYDIGDGGSNTALVPVDELEALFVFAPTTAVLSLVQRWVSELDQVSLSQGGVSEGMFWYKVRNTPAAELAATLNAVVGGVVGVREETKEDQRLQGRSKAEGESSVVTVNQGGFVVNDARNMLLFRGESDRWQRLLPLIRELDVPPEQVLIEVIVAEVTLTDEFRFGVEWALNQISAAGAVGGLTSIFGSGAPGAGLDAGGLTWASVSGSGNTRLALNAFASSDRVSILQTPRILVRSGEEATVKVGSEVPVITRQSTGDSTVSGTSSINQEVQYRSTGVRLTVKPHVFSNGRIDIEIAQEVSEAQPTQSSTINSPTILNREVETRLSLENGSSVLLGGLISTTESKGDSRVPFLGDLPGVGHLFRSDSTTGGRTELMVMVVPYLIRNGQQAEKITEAFRGRLKYLKNHDAKESVYNAH